MEWEWGRRGGVGACGEGGNVVGVDEGGLGEERAEERWRRREGEREEEVVVVVARKRRREGVVSLLVAILLKVTCKLQLLVLACLARVHACRMLWRLKQHLTAVGHINIRMQGWPYGYRFINRCRNWCIDIDVDLNAAVDAQVYPVKDVIEAVAVDAAVDVVVALDVSVDVAADVDVEVGCCEWMRCRQLLMHSYVRVVRCVSVCVCQCVSLCQCLSLCVCLWVVVLVCGGVWCHLLCAIRRFR